MKRRSKRQTKRRRTRKGGAGAIHYGDTQTWGNSNHYAYNNNPKIFTTSPNYYTQKNGGRRKMRGGFLTDALRIFQPLSSFWENNMFISDSSTRAFNGLYPGIDPSPLKQFFK